MATKTFNDICVEYAHQLGKGLPLTAPEMCNALVMYLNQQVNDMNQMVQTALNAVKDIQDEIDDSNIAKLNKSQTFLYENTFNSKINADKGIDSGDRIVVGDPETGVTINSNNISLRDTASTINIKSPANAGTQNVVLPSRSGILALRTDIPEVPNIPEPTASDNGKVIGVQNGAYSLIEQSGGEVPANMVNTDTTQTITGIKFFGSTSLRNGTQDKYTMYCLERLSTCESAGSCNNISFAGKSGVMAVESDIPDLSSPASVVYEQETGATITYGTTNAKEFVIPIIAGDNVTIDADSSGTHVTIGVEGVLTTATTMVDFNNFKVIDSAGQNIIGYCNNLEDTLCVGSQLRKTNLFSQSRVTVNTVNQVAYLTDIPDLDNYTGIVHIVQGTAGGGIAVHDTANASPYTKYGYDKIETYGNSNTLQYTLNIPNKNGTIATLDDIPSAPSSDKYFTRVIYHSTDDDTQYVIFSCTTDTDLSTNTSYQNVIDLLNNLGATTQDTALPCTGKTGSGDIVVGVYTDGSNIIVFNTDSTTEELSISAEIKFISK